MVKHYDERGITEWKRVSLEQWFPDSRQDEVTLYLAEISYSGMLRWSKELPFAIPEDRLG